jgi:hypothetical protein
MEKNENEKYMGCEVIQDTKTTTKYPPIVARKVVVTDEVYAAIKDALTRGAPPPLLSDKREGNEKTHPYSRMMASSTKRRLEGRSCLHRTPISRLMPPTSEAVRDTVCSTQLRVSEMVP